MPFPMRIQPIDSFASEDLLRVDQTKPVAKSRLKRLLERQFPSVLRISASEKQDQQSNKDGSCDLEPSSLCLAKMVQNFMEETNEKQLRCSRNRCNCFKCGSNSDDESETFVSTGDSFVAAVGESCEVLKGMVSCSSIAERNLLADTSSIVEKNKICGGKEECRKIVVENLIALGYDTSICKSRWEKSPSIPAGEYEYIDVIVEGERLLVDIDFKSEFEIARSTSSYRSVLQSLPAIFVGKSDRLQQIITVVSEAAKQSLKKKGLHFPPWRKPEYVRAKWLSPYTRTTSKYVGQKEPTTIPPSSLCSELEFPLDGSIKEEKISFVVSSPWQPPAIKHKESLKGAKMITGLASVLTEKP